MDLATGVGQPVGHPVSGIGQLLSGYPQLEHQMVEIDRQPDPERQPGEDEQVGAELPGEPARVVCV
jgi:hypothetical protein